MSYSKKYLLNRVEAVVEIYKKYHKQGLSNKFIYENHIKEQYGISIGTFYNYLTIPYQKLRLEMKKKSD